jgi:hypothetical protein
MKMGKYFVATVFLAGVGVVGGYAAARLYSHSLPEEYLAVAAGSDFSPPLGRAANPPAASAGERRLLTATSTDGVHFTATGKILTDQGNVPDVIVDSEGALRVYYIGQSIEAGKEENTVMAISRDNGVSWEFHTLTFNDLPQPRDPSDPDVVVLDDGTYRMYYTSSLSSTKIGIVYADSPDGITFTYGGVALNGEHNANDSSTMFFDGLWHMYILREDTGVQLHATSSDGKTFAYTDEPNVVLPADGYIISNGLSEGDTFRMFGFNLAEKDIRSFTSPNMTTWVADDVALEGDAAATLNTMYIQDLSVGQLPNGSYFMVYVSKL